MVEYRDDCVGCAVPGYPCQGDRCKNRNVKYLICDNCGSENEEVLYDGLCADCFLKTASTIEYLDD